MTQHATANTPAFLPDPGEDHDWTGGLPVQSARIGGAGLRCDHIGGQLWVTVPIVWSTFTPDLDDTGVGWWTPDDSAAHTELPFTTLNGTAPHSVLSAEAICGARLRAATAVHLKKARRGPLSAARLLAT